MSDVFCDRRADAAETAASFASFSQSPFVVRRAKSHVSEIIYLCDLCFVCISARIDKFSLFIAV